MDLPFIEVFRTPNSGYFFDVNQNELVPVSDLTFQYLQELISTGGNPELPTPQEFIDLKSQGYLASESVV